MHCSFSSHPFPSSLIVLWRTPLFPCLALVTIWKSYPDPEYLFVYADALLQCAWATTYRSYTAYKDIMFPGILHLKLPIKKWVHMVSKGPWSLKKKKKDNKKRNINQRGLLLPQQFLWPICCLSWERKQDKNSIYELFSQQQLPQFAVTSKIMWLYMLCSTKAGQSICIHAKISVLEGSARSTCHTGYAMHAEYVWLYS